MNTLARDAQRWTYILEAKTQDNSWVAIACSKLYTTNLWNTNTKLFEPICFLSGLRTSCLSDINTKTRNAFSKNEKIPNTTSKYTKAIYTKALTKNINPPWICLDKTTSKHINQINKAKNWALKIHSITNIPIILDMENPPYTEHEADNFKYDQSAHKRMELSLIHI